MSFEYVEYCVFIDKYWLRYESPSDQCDESDLLKLTIQATANLKMDEIQLL